MDNGGVPTQAAIDALQYGTLSDEDLKACNVNCDFLHLLASFCSFVDSYAKSDSTSTGMIKQYHMRNCPFKFYNPNILKEVTKAVQRRDQELNTAKSPVEI